MNPAAEGTVYPGFEFVVDPERVAAFREVFGQGSGVPPTFLTTAEFEALPMVLADPNVGLDFTRVLHGSQAYEYRRPLREGERLLITMRITSIRSKGGSWFMSLVTEATDDSGELVATATNLMIERAPA